MQTRVRFLTSTSTVLLLLFNVTGCKRAEAPDQPRPASPAQQSSATSNNAAPPPVDPEASARYACDGGNWVDIVRERTARLSLSDGRKCEIQRVQDSKPRTFMGQGLTLVETGDGTAELSDETDRTLACQIEP